MGDWGWKFSGCEVDTLDLLKVLDRRDSGGMSNLSKDQVPEDGGSA